MVKLKLCFLVFITTFQCCRSQEMMTKKELRKQRVYLSIEEVIKNDRGLLSLHVIETKGLTIVPESIFDHSEIQILNISGAKLGSISENIRNLKRLQYLNLIGDSLTIIPRLSEMDNLKELILSDNYISHTSEWVFQNKSLSLLDVSNQLVDSLELTSIASNHTLKTLNLSNNKLKITEGFFNFQNLEHLNLSNCSLTTIPEEIKNCSAIKYLDLSGNEINKLPDWIFEMKNLNQIILSNTKLERFPEKLTDIPTLTFIDVRGTKMELSKSAVDRIKEKGNRFLEIYWKTKTSSIKKIKIN